MRKPSLSARLLAACMLLSACAGTETGNPPFSGELAYNTHATAPAVAALRRAEGGARVDSAWLVLGDGRFVPADRCERRQGIADHVDGLGAGDHATETAARTPFELLPGEYCGLELPLMTLSPDDLPADAPEALAGRSLVLTGETAEGVPFSIASEMETRWFLDATEGAFYLGPGSERLLVGFDVSDWLRGVALETASVEADGRIAVTPEDNSALLQAFEANVYLGLDLYRDPDGVGEIGEDAEQIAAGSRR